MPDPQYATERTRQFRQTELSEFNKKKIKDIEEFGCQVLHVGRTCQDDLSFAYTVGIYDTCGHPELIEVGLPQETAHSLLNDAAARLRRGVDLSHGRHADLLSNVECEFRPVDPKWVKRLMYGATWFYRETEYPVLQVVYPDLENCKLVTANWCKL